MNTTNIKLISCDLDGTLLNAHGEISSYSKAILIDLQKRGYCLVLNSGRFYHEVEPFIEQLELSTYGGYVICSNGYVIHDCKNHTEHAFDAISNKECIRLFNLAENAHVITFYYANGTYSLCTSKIILLLQYIGRGVMWLSYPFLPPRFKKYMNMFRHTLVHTYTQIPSFDYVEKLCFIQAPLFLQKIKKTILKQEQGYHFFDVNACSVEIVKENVSKAKAISYLCEQKGYTLQDVIAFGDAGNDIPLLQQAGIGVLMKNAHHHMNVYTDIYTEQDNDHDGVTVFLKKHLIKM